MKMTLTIFAASLLLVSAPIVAADAESEADPACEEGQAWVGYNELDPATNAVEALAGEGTLFACEGEHWDGQDPINGDDAATQDCITSVQASADGVVLCMGSDPNVGDADPTLGASPAALRISLDGTSGAYVASNIFMVGRAVVYTDGAHIVAVYLKDNTPGNVLATAISAPGITQGHPSEADCDQETYAEGAFTQNRELCGRDNTAITVFLA